MFIIGAQLGFELAFRQELPVTLLWIPSGLALATVLLRGTWALPGIFIGGFITALLQFSLPSILQTLAVATIGSTSISVSASFGANGWLPELDWDVFIIEET